VKQAHDSVVTRAYNAVKADIKGKKKKKHMSDTGEPDPKRQKGEGSKERIEVGKGQDALAEEEESPFVWGVAVYNKFVYLGRADPKEGRFQQLDVETKKLLPKQLFLPARSTFLFHCQTMEELLNFTEQSGECLDTAAHLLMLPEGSIVAQAEIMGQQKLFLLPTTHQGS